MKFCEQCRLKNKWAKNPGFPFIGVIGHGQCEVCRAWNQLHEVDPRYLKSETEKSKDEKTVDEMRQIMYRNLAEELAIYHDTGLRAGQINEAETADLKKLVVNRNNKIDWIATYNLRLEAVKGAQLEAQRKKNRR